MGLDKSGEACSILVIDDEPSILRMISRILQDTGCNILTALDAEQAMQLVEAAKPTLVITDIRLPGMNGLDLARWIKERLPRTPVVLISAYGEPHGHAGDAFIPKPFDNEQLLEMARRYLGGDAQGGLAGDAPGGWPLDIRF